MGLLLVLKFSEFFVVRTRLEGVYNQCPPSSIITSAWPPELSRISISNFLSRKKHGFSVELRDTCLTAMYVLIFFEKPFYHFPYRLDNIDVCQYSSECIFFDQLNVMTIHYSNIKIFNIGQSIIQVLKIIV